MLSHRRQRTGTLRLRRLRGGSGNKSTRLGADAGDHVHHVGERERAGRVRRPHRRSSSPSTTASRSSSTSCPTTRCSRTSTRSSRRATRPTSSASTTATSASTPARTSCSTSSSYFTEDEIAAFVPADVAGRVVRRQALRRAAPDRRVGAPRQPRHAEGGRHRHRPRCRPRRTTRGRGRSSPTSPRSCARRCPTTSTRSSTTGSRSARRAG